jgi:hypothetical protein
MTDTQLLHAAVADMHAATALALHPAKRPVTATSLREYHELVIKANAKGRAHLYGAEDAERYEASELKRLYAFSDEQILAGAHRPSAEDVYDRLTSGGGIADAYECGDWKDEEGDVNDN